jgi:hypothetical protein
LKAEVEYEMARELIRMGKPEEGVREIQKLIEKHPELELFRNIGNTLNHLKKPIHRVFAEDFSEGIRLEG